MNTDKMTTYLIALTGCWFPRRLGVGEVVTGLTVRNKILQINKTKKKKKKKKNKKKKKL